MNGVGALIATESSLRRPRVAELAIPSPFVHSDWIGSQAAPVSVVDAGRLTGRVR
jgi:hypothetical protein